MMQLVMDGMDAIAIAIDSWPPELGGRNVR
jgi:hypothetical protein